MKTDRLTVLLNGGEPTLHPGLAGFCEKAGKAKNLTVMLCTNMSADKDVYRTLQRYGVKLLPTYHEEHFTLDRFSEKLEDLNVVNVLVPCTLENVAGIDNLMKTLPAAKPMLLENRNVSPAEIKALSTVDGDVTRQYRTLLNARKKTPRRCGSRGRYLAVGGNGDVYQCMFLQDDFVFGNIKDADLVIDPARFRTVCGNEYCFYEF